MGCMSSSATREDRSDDRWLSELGDVGPRGDAARRDLRARLVAALQRAFGNRAAAHVEDFAQEAMVRIHRQLGAFRGESRFTTWAISIAVRVATSELRRARWKDVSLEALVADAPDAIPEPSAPVASLDAERALAQARAVAALERAIESHLTERQRSVIAAELRGMPQDVIAEQLGTNRNAIYKVAFDARKALLAALAAEGMDASTLRWAFDEDASVGGPS